jgi:hypothetical protein
MNACEHVVAKHLQMLRELRARRHPIGQPNMT